MSHFKCPNDLKLLHSQQLLTRLRVNTQDKIQLERAFSNLEAPSRRIRAFFNDGLKELEDDYYAVFEEITRRMDASTIKEGIAP